MSKQTAVEWLVEELFKKIDYIQVDPRIINHAIAMECEQIKDAYFSGMDDSDRGEYKGEIEYYNETFNK
jgi:hypothetical protein